MSQFARRLGHRTFAIFLFHGVVREHRHQVRNYTRKHLTLSRFEEVLRELLAGGTPVSIPDIVDAARYGRRLPPRAFAVTFDDGFENNASVAAPALRKAGIPATFYVTSGFVDRNSASWIDEIEEAVEKTEVVRLHLPLKLARETFRDPQEKRELLDAIRKHVKGDPRIDPYEFSRDVRRQLATGPFVPDVELDQKLTWEQIGELSRDPLFTVGGHGHTHRILSFLDPLQLEEELATSLGRVRGATGSGVLHYSYPEGLAHCYSEAVIGSLRRHGIVCAPTAEDGVNQVGDDLFRLKRIMVT
ncbi:MAG TPA: polysaccharide deacetylase family protein [Planctomycetota bacterium]|nr:polysaccharide deacetylase family protein [Planctomycetota bacterium]